MTVPEPSPIEEWVPSAPSATPGLAGYVVAILISWVLISVGLGLSSVDLSDTLGWNLEVFGVGTMFWGFLAGLFAVATAPWGAVIVHFSCFWVRLQWVHVLVTAVVGGLAVYGVALVLGENPRDWDTIAAGVGACTSFSRALLIPWVPIIRDGYPPDTPAWRRWRLH